MVCRWHEATHGRLSVTGQQAADVAVLLGGHELQIHRIERDDDMIGQLIALERRFWDYVESDTPPPAGGTDSADRALRTLFPKDDGKTLDFSQDENLSQAFDELQQAMGSATQANFATGRITWKQAQTSTRLDGKALQKDHPDLCAQYLTTVPGSRRFVVRS